jgi:preprotein translocase subunit SecA
MKLPGVTQIQQFKDQLLGRTTEIDLTGYQPLLEQINNLEALYRPLDDEKLQRTFRQIRRRVQARLDNDELPANVLAENLADCYAMVREAARRLLGMRHFDVQIIAGIALDQGKIAEMQNGEGKTMAALLPVCLNALTGKGVHVLTSNDYLAQRDAHWMGPVYEWFGFSVGIIQSGLDSPARKSAYASDITYAAAREVGYDLLRSNLSYSTDALVLPGFNMALIDEADAILIDEARVPLVIAGDLAGGETRSGSISEIVGALQVGEDYDTDNEERNVSLTENGVGKVEALLGCDNLFDAENTENLTRLYFALQAHVLLKKDVDYIVRDGGVSQIDPFTGRVARDRQWPQGLQSAVAEKENLTVAEAGLILNSITPTNFLAQYPKLAGMTATASAADEELWKMYDLPVVVVPPNRESRRENLPDLVFTHREAKEQAVIVEIIKTHITGRPILVGTGSIHESNRIADQLSDTGIECRVLNAKTDALEAEIIKEAGRCGAVTIATNMAGRGTDIKLGGSDGAEREQVAELGGLYVIGTQRHGSRRIDDQLSGRAGRQGEPGTARFFISLEDDFLRRYGITEQLGRHGLPIRQAAAIQLDGLADEIERAQRVIAGERSELRQTLQSYTSILERQRQVLAERRRRILVSDPLTRPLSLASDPQTRDHFRQLSSRYGIDATATAEKTITLYHIDRCWAEHLTAIASMRDGVHLTRAAGKNPLHEFQVSTTEAFMAMQDDIESRIESDFLALPLNVDRLDVEWIGIQPPKATWTYSMNEHLDDDWVLELTAQGNIGLSVGAAILGPLFLCLAAYRKLKTWQNRRFAAML